MVSTVAEIALAFAVDGPLAHAMPGFHHRELQVNFAQAIAEALQSGTPAVLEAGTGTGKTFAYLAPLLLAGRKTIISTSTKSLQDQLYQKDVPQIVKALGIQAEVRLLKGRGNYVCLKRLEAIKQDEQQRKLFKVSTQETKEIAMVAAYAERTSSGDLTGMSKLRVRSPILPWVTSTIDNCSGSKCEYFNECFVFKAWKRARGAQIVIVNHALLGTLCAHGKDLEDFLAGFDTLIFDEAHHLLDVLPRIFAKQLMLGKLQALLLEADTLVQSKLPNEQTFTALLRKAKDCCDELVERFQKFPGQPTRSQHLLGDKKIIRVLDQATKSLEQLGSENEQEVDLGSEFAELRTQFVDAGSLLKTWQNPTPTKVDWLESDRGGTTLFSSPINYSELFRQHFVDKMTTVMVSATLSVDGSLEHYVNRLGLQDASRSIWESSFDYAKQAVLYLPQNMPDPRTREKDFVQAVAEQAAQLVRANSGGSFVLFSTWRNMKFGADLLADMLVDEGGILVQGKNSPAKLLAQLRASKGPRVLVGTRTFWQGVDISGKALQLVVIDKIPFTPPNDPLLESALEQYPDPERAFVDVQVAQAALLLKQAAGRLIRSESDQGVLVLCDPRINNYGYGEIIKRSLPPMCETKQLQTALDFFQHDR